jgi:F-type H+-transporting ATPase subunit b
VELNWSTFLLEILNFIVLLWILKHFLYQPVLDTIARRRAGIKQTLANAQAIRTAAEAMQGQYESRLNQWNGEREAAREALRQDIAGERERQLASLKDELVREREKAKVLDEKLQADALRKYQEASLDIGARFVSRLLSELTGPELEIRLFDLALRQLDSLPETRINAIRLACEETPEEAEVATAYPLDPLHRQRLAEKLGRLLEMPVACRFVEDSQLLAGLRITLGPWVFHANLQEELKSFASSAHEPN